MIFAESPEELPVVRRIGDLIRIKDARFCYYNGHKQFTLDTQYESEWALYSSKPHCPLGNLVGDNPMDHSAERSFESNMDEINIRRRLRNFLVEVDNTERQIQKDDDEWDVFSKVTRVRPDGFNINGFSVQADMSDFEHVILGSKIRIRAAFKDGDQLILAQFSTVLINASDYKANEDLLRSLFH